MGIIRGTNIIRDGLVYGYDTGYGIADNETTTRFYPGEPTTNEFYGSGSNGNILDHSSGYGGYGTAQTGALDAFGTTENTVYRNTGKMRLGPTGGQDIGTLTNGNTYTFSVYLRHVPGENNVPGSNGFEFDIVDKADSRNYQGTLDSNMTYDWKRFSVTALHNNNSNYHFIDVGTYQGTNVWEWCMPQIEVGSHATPYTRTSRSATASLIDLTRTVNIDVSNASFDSTGQPVFDGTDDILNTGQFSGRNPSTDVFSIEAIVKSDTTSGNHMWVDASGNGNNQRLYCAHASTGTSTPLGIQNSGWSHSIPQDTDYHHYVITMNGSTATLYNNAVSHSSKNYTSYTLSGQINVGGRSGYRWNGDIPVFKLYNKVLQASEITQNYKAYKNRFNI